VQVLKGDGITPVVGEVVTFTASAGTAQFAACGAASCTVSTNAQGIAATLVTPQTAGAISLQATGIDGTASASFTALVRIRTTTAVQPVEYIAAGATVTWAPQVSVLDNFASTIGALIDWKAVSGPVAVSPGQSQVNSQGIASTVAMVGPLVSGAQAALTGCAWASTCATFTTQGVDPAEFQLVVVSGAGQNVSAGSNLVPVVVQVVDSAFHPVAGAAVQIYQTVDAWQPPCPDRGRCPIAPIIASSQSTLTSDAYGILTVSPEQLSGVAGTTNLAAAAGTQGFLSLTLEKQP
jgi:hypothetical protein